jgi:hypothetical protein
MSRWDEYGDSADKINKEQKPETWQPIGALVLADIERIVGKITDERGKHDENPV